MNNKAFETLMIGLIKEASRWSFSEFLDDRGISEEEYAEIKKHLQETYGIKLYI
ncbi:hypothetical protein [Bacillus pumilus]|jgi:hypothetical protein|uniref:hypothetical protein n=1 Tax=Bacillus pumilus TaxID=1408 RepID=UPI0012DB1071|nr:hypothetical protein [Bacillus pumilus]MBR0588675.1 hypothetical protein [Bacillus pumilus DW2J2]MBR0618643.1 hypothetical protein [Bacillus pumilus]MBR0624711.1 hypothetical protein [Bacillus pumilus]MCY7724068.1 hypothetical protein [Bacillus pumilus]MCY7747442.1 hypothetical protein [Bacillus pumilus]